MILSALLTSVGINLGVCLLFFALYSILRNQRQVTSQSIPLACLVKEKTQQEDEFNLERLLPSPGWVKRAWRPSEDELSSITGLGVVVFMRVFIFCVRAFTFASVVGIFILLPINFLGNQLTDDFSDLPKKSLDSFSISNVNDGSNRTFVSDLISGYLPSQIEKSACTKLLWFTVWNIFFANVLSGSALSMVNIFLEPKKNPSLLGEAVSAQASFFIAYVVTSGWTILSSELFHLIPLLYGFMQRLFAGKDDDDDDDDFEIPSIPYHGEIPGFSCLNFLMLLISSSLH